MHTTLDGTTVFSLNELVITGAAKGEPGSIQHLHAYAEAQPGCIHSLCLNGWNHGIRRGRARLYFVQHGLDIPPILQGEITVEELEYRLNQPRKPVKRRTTRGQGDAVTPWVVEGTGRLRLVERVGRGQISRAEAVVELWDWLEDQTYHAVLGDSPFEGKDATGGLTYLTQAGREKVLTLCNLGQRFDREASKVSRGM